MRDYILKRTDWRLAPRRTRSRYDGARRGEMRVLDDRDLEIPEGFEIRTGAAYGKPCVAVFHKGAPPKSRPVLLTTGKTIDDCLFGTRMWVNRYKAAQRNPRAMLTARVLDSRGLIEEEV